LGKRVTALITGVICVLVIAMSIAINFIF
jgi:hypothetical protein